MQAIIDSLRRFGQQKPIIVGKLPGSTADVVIAGNGTFAAAKQLGWTEVQVIRTTLTPSEARAYGIADNRTSDLSEFDFNALAGLFQFLSAADTQVADLGFSEIEVRLMLASAETTGAGEAVTQDQAWQDMPEFVQDDKQGRMITVHFETPEAVKAFAAAIGQVITDKTHGIWYPAKAKERLVDTNYE
jgi:hypothetical protein